MDDKTPQVRTVVADIAQLIKDGKLTAEEAKKIDPAVLSTAQKYAEAIGITNFDLSVIAPQFIKDRSASRLIDEQEFKKENDLKSIEDPEETKAKIEQSSDKASLEDMAGVELVSSGKKDDDEIIAEAEIVDPDNGDFASRDKPLKVFDLNEEETLDGNQTIEGMIKSTNFKAEKKAPLVGTPRIHENDNSTKSPFTFNSLSDTKSVSVNQEIKNVQNTKVEKPLNTPSNLIEKTVEVELTQTEIEKLNQEESELEQKIQEVEQAITALEEKKDEYISQKQDMLFTLDDVINKEKAVEIEEKEIEQKEVEHPEQKRTLEPTRWSLEDTRNTFEKQRWEINSQLTDLEKTEHVRSGEEDSIQEKRKFLQSQEKRIKKRIELLHTLEKIDELRKSINTLQKYKKTVENEKDVSADSVEASQKIYTQKNAEEKRIKKLVTDIEKKQKNSITEEERFALGTERNQLEVKLRSVLADEWTSEDDLATKKETFTEKMRTIKKIETDVLDAQKNLLNLEKSEL